MRLQTVTIQYFRNFVEPQTIAIEPELTCLVGKNESGKTTILKALHRLKPANAGDRRFKLVTEYPRWRLAPDRRRDPDLEQINPVTAEFLLDDADLASLSAVLPGPVPQGAVCVASRSYADEVTVALRADLPAIVRASAAAADLPDSELEPLLAETDVTAIRDRARARAKELKEDADATLVTKALTAFVSALGKNEYLLDGASLEQEALDALWELVPSFFYFSNYQSLPGECDLTRLAARIDAGEELSARQETVVALLAHAGEEPKDFLDEDYDSRKAELQAASSDLSRHAFEYWRQNTDLAVIFDTDNVRVETLPSGGDITHRMLKIELRDDRHGGVETNFETRSSGFQWFFSFFAAFSAHQESEEPLVVLLDEPGTSLHGEAQHDFVRFMSEELARSKQTLYTTHSQHMVDPTRYEILRAVDDQATRESPDQGVVVTPISLSADRDTLLPVESALGYTISQHLFIGSGHHLAVEGSSDFIFLQRLTEHRLSQGKTDGLDPRLAVIPVGGADNMPVFVALLGRRLKISALIDGARASAKMTRITAAAKANDVPTSALVVCADADEDLPKTADIEDLFEVVDYLRLYNWAFDAALAESDLPTTSEPILRRLEQKVGQFDHALPAHALTEHRAEFFASVATKTVERFVKLFALLNATLEPVGSTEPATAETAPDANPETA